MAHQVHVMSESASSSECGSFRSPSLSFVVLEHGGRAQEPDADVREDKDLILIEDLTARVNEMNEAMAQSQNCETTVSYQSIDEEKERFRQRIRQLEEQKAMMELSLRKEIRDLQQHIQESKTTTMMTSMSASAYQGEDLGTIVEQLSTENSELKKQLEGASSSSKLVSVVKTKNKEIKTKEQAIEKLKKEKEELESLLLEEQENGTKERTSLVQQIEALSKSKNVLPDANLSAELKAKEEALGRKDAQISQLKEEKSELESLLLEEQETASKKEEQMQERIMELEKAKKSSPSGSLQSSGDLRAKEEELRRKEKRITALQEQKDELESLLLEEQENASQQKEQLEARIAELMKGVPSDNAALSREKEALDQRCASLKQQIAEMKKVYEDQLTDLRSNHEIDIASLRVQLAEMTKRHETELENLRENNEDVAPLRQQLDAATKRHEAEMTNLRKSHDDAMKEQQARAKTEINQLKRELSSFKRNVSPEGAAGADEIEELRGLNERLENKLREYEISTNKLNKKKGDLLAEMRTLRSDKARLEAELVISQRQMADRSSASDETEILRERASKLEQDCENHQRTIRDLEENILRLQSAAHENRSSPNRPTKDADENQHNLLQIYHSLTKISSAVVRRKEERLDKKSGRALTEAIIRLSETAARAGREQSELLNLALKEKDFEKMKRREAERKLIDGKVRASQQLENACHHAKQELAAQFAEHANHQRQFIDFLQTRLELVTSPFFQQRMQPMPAYNGCSHFVGQPLPQP